MIILAESNTQKVKSDSQIKLASRLYWPSFVKSLSLTFKNIHVLILIELYVLAFYVGCYLFTSKRYILAGIVFALFTAFISSTFYMIGQVVKTGKFPIKDLFKSYKALYVRANLVLLIWYFVFFLINYALVTPISSLIKGQYLLYGVIVPVEALIFFIFNSLPEAIYASEKNFESLLMDSINFIEKYWLIWLIPTIVLLFLVNITDHRLSIMPTLGALKPKGLLLKIEDITFYIRSLIITVALIFRGILYTKLTDTAK